MYYGGEPPAWTVEPAELSAEARFPVVQTPSTSAAPSIPGMADIMAAELETSWLLRPALGVLIIVLLCLGPGFSSLAAGPPLPCWQAPWSMGCACKHVRHCPLPAGSLSSNSRAATCRHVCPRNQPSPASSCERQGEARRAPPRAAGGLPDALLWGHRWGQRGGRAGGKQHSTDQEAHGRAQPCRCGLPSCQSGLHGRLCSLVLRSVQSMLAVSSVLTSVASWHDANAGRGAA